MKILITGGTGFLGMPLGVELVRRGHELVVVSRNVHKAQLQLPFPCSLIQGDLAEGPLSSEKLSDVEAVIHLMGETVAGLRWTKEKKQKILDSRILSTRNLLKSFQVLRESKLKVVLGASAIGYYGDARDQFLSEDSPPGSDFLSQVCQCWEAEQREFGELSSKPRLVHFRIGLVLSAFGGAVERMLLPFRMGLGGALGRGTQWMSWIHRDDLISMFCEAVESQQWVGPINAVSPAPVTNLEFSATLAQALKVKTLAAVPEFVLKTAMGEMSTLVLGSAKVEPRRAKNLNFVWKYPALSAALTEVCSFFQHKEMLFFSQQFLPWKTSEVFPFFAEARNLEQITPPLLQFKITQISTPKICEGTLIDYRLRVHGIGLRWRTQIIDWRPPTQFVDDQLQGPYRRWHHTHTFEDLGPGCLMTDLVRYQLPFGWWGFFLAGSFVRQDIYKIFNYRRQVCSRVQFRSS